MNQTFQATTTSRAILKDKAKGALSGRYSKFILAFLTTSVLTSIIHFAVDYFVSLAVNGVLVSNLTASGKMSSDQLYSFIQSEEYSYLLMQWYIPISHVFTAIAQIFTTIFSIGLALVALNIACGNYVQTSDIFYGFRNDFSKAFKISAVLVLIEQVMQIPYTYLNYALYYTNTDQETLILPLILLVAGIILYVILHLGFSQVLFLYLDFPGHSAGQLIRESLRIMKGHKKRFFLLGLSFLPLLLLVVLTFGLGALWLTPYMQLTYAFFFLDLMHSRNNNYQ